MKNIGFLLLITIVLFGCQSDPNKSTVETVKAKGRFEIDLPKFLSKTQHIHNDATLQYTDSEQEFFCIVIEEPNEEFIALVSLEQDSTLGITPDFRGYTYILKENVKRNIQNLEILSESEDDLNGSNAQFMTLRGEAQGVPIFYKLAYVEGPKHYYQIATWSSIDKQEVYEETMENIIESFRLTNK